MLGQPFARAPGPFTCCLLCLDWASRRHTEKFLPLRGLQVIAPVGAGVLLDGGARRQKARLLCKKGAPSRAVVAVLTNRAQREQGGAACVSKCRCTMEASLARAALCPALSCSSSASPSWWR